MTGPLAWAPCQEPPDPRRRGRRTSCPARWAAARCRGAASTAEFTTRPRTPAPLRRQAGCHAEQASLLQSQQAAAGLGLHTLAWQFADTARGHVKSPVRPSAARRTRRPAAEPAPTRRRIRGCQ